MLDYLINLYLAAFVYNVILFDSGIMYARSSFDSIFLYSYGLMDKFIAKHSKE